MIVLKNILLVIVGFFAMLFVLKLSIVLLGLTFALLGLAIKLAIIGAILYVAYSALKGLAHMA